MLRSRLCEMLGYSECGDRISGLRNDPPRPKPAPKLTIWDGIVPEPVLPHQLGLDERPEAA